MENANVPRIVEVTPSILKAQETAERLRRAGYKVAIKNRRIKAARAVLDVECVVITGERGES